MALSVLAKVLTAAVLAAPALAAADTWRGTAPFCNGECLPGETEIRRDTRGNGAACWTGTKALCRNDQELCTPAQTQTSCFGFVLVCDDGFFRIPDVWVSCSRYACGGCLGFDF
jgi:hypothetical protein